MGSIFSLISLKETTDLAKAKKTKQNKANVPFFCKVDHKTSSYTTHFLYLYYSCLPAFLIRNFFPRGFGFFLSFLYIFCCSETCCFFVIPELRNMVIIKT